MAKVRGPSGRRPRPADQIERRGVMPMRGGEVDGTGGGTREDGEAGVVTVLETGEETDWSTMLLLPDFRQGSHCHSNRISLKQSPGHGSDRLAAPHLMHAGPRIVAGGDPCNGLQCAKRPIDKGFHRSQRKNNSGTTEIPDAPHG